MKAVVAVDINRLKVADVLLDAPRNGEVRVRMAATGVCHSDLSVLNGTVPIPLPTVLGHEGAGIVTDVGPDVTHLRAGDHVVLSFVRHCGHCHFCVRQEPHLCQSIDIAGHMPDGTSRLHLGDRPLGAMAQLGCMAEYAVVPADSVVAIDRDIPLDRAALVGCAVMTGVGAVTGTAKVTPGASVAIFGCGGVGLAAVQGARLAGAARVIAIDLAPGKLDIASRLGATDTVLAGECDPVQAVAQLTDALGADYSFDFTGLPAVMMQAYAAARRGGTVCIAGVGSFTETFQLNAGMFAPESKRLLGCYYGSANFRFDMPLLLSLYQRGQLDLDSLITRTYRIDQAKDAFNDLESGSNVRGVIVFD